MALPCQWQHGDGLVSEDQSLGHPWMSRSEVLSMFSVLERSEQSPSLGRSQHSELVCCVEMHRAARAEHIVLLFWVAPLRWLLGRKGPN